MLLTLIGFIPGVGPFLVFAGRNPWVKRALDIAAAVTVVLALVFAFALHERHLQAAKDRAAAAAALAAAQQRGLAAARNADASRSADAATVAARQKDLTDAIAQAPDGQPSAADRALNCRRLCGTAQARLPEFSRLCGPDACRQAKAHP